MNKKSNFRIFNIAVLVFAIAAVIAAIAAFFIFGQKEEPALEESPDNLVITNLNVGKGDAAFLTYKGQLGIIDTGSKDSFDVITDYMTSNNRDSIDFMVISHYDKDHVGGAVKLLKQYDVKMIYLPSYESPKSGYSKLLKAVEGKENVVFVKETESVSIEDITMQLIPASQPEALLADENDLDNNMSLLCMVTHGEKRFLFTGDIEKARIAQILEDRSDLKADWLKVPYHGGYEDNSKEFLALVAPEIAVISTGTERPADNRTQALLKGLGSRIYNTIHGSVCTTCDGTEISVKYLK